MLKKIILGFVIMFALAFDGGAQIWSVIQNPQVSFKIKNTGIDVDGRFPEMTAKVSLNESNYSLSTFEGTVTVKSVTTDNTTRDRHIVEKTEFFNAKKYPTITMKAVKIASQPTNGSYKVDWLLTIKGITKKVTTDVLIAPMGNAMYLLTVFKINRLDWKLGPRSITMANDVYITLNTNVTK